MTTTTMHFGPEWMRTKSSQTQQNVPSTMPGQSPASGASLTASPPAVQSDEPSDAQGSQILQYSKEELLRIYRNLAKTTLPADVEKWEGVVRDTPAEPISLREMNEAEKKLFAGPLNSELRRRQSSDYLSPLATQNLTPDRSRLNSASLSPLRDRFGTSMMKRRDSTDQPPPRKLSLTGSQPLVSPREAALPSPRTRYGGTGFDGVLNGGEAWGIRRRVSEGLLKTGSVQDIEVGTKIREEDETAQNAASDPAPPPSQSQTVLENGSTPLYIEPNNVPATPPGLDLASIEWSYLDPQGQTQGPFRADLMQKWHEEGYFTPDLPMKRPAFDKDWITFGMLSAQSTGHKIFLSPFPPLPPPQPMPTRDSLPNSLIQDAHMFPTTYHPSPIRTLRAPTLDSYNTESTSSSPASSFGVGRFGNASPDTNALGGIISSSYSSNEPILGSRVGSFTAESTLVRRRSTLQDAADGIQNSVSTGNLVTRAGSTDSFTYSGPSVNPWTPPIHESIPPSPFANLPSRPSYAQGQSHDPSFSDPSAGNVPFDYGSFVEPPAQPLTNEHVDYTVKQPFSATTLSVGSAAPSRVLPQQNAWPLASEVPELKRPGPFDPKHPKSSNTVALPSPLPSDPSPQSQQPIREVVLPVEPSSVNVDSVASLSPEQPEKVVATVDPPEQIVPSRKSKKSSGQPPAAVISQPPVESATTIAPKPAWSKQDDTRKPSGVSLSLREIQEAELKKAEARKAADRERERAARANAPTPSSEQVTVFTTSWGLASSHVGTRPPTKDSPIAQSPSTPASPTPVWTTGAKPTATKSMKEIQEEEERRKKTTPKETAAAIASRRLQTEPPVQKNTVSPAQNAWTTIGHGGKPNATTRPPAIATTASSSSVPKANGAPPASSRPSNSSLKLSSPSSSKPDDTPAPSPEFIKWLSDNLKGLNSSVKVEEIMAMLLSFALDPDPSTVELISDLIYANSTTLDGRRFAAEFISRRKADASSRNTTSGTTAGSGKSISIADVVKSQPKPPASTEWGFKVVNKKKKGGRT